jgi:hypothetical protein
MHVLQQLVLALLSLMCDGHPEAVGNEMSITDRSTSSAAL